MADEVLLLPFPRGKLKPRSMFAPVEKTPQLEGLQPRTGHFSCLQSPKTAEHMAPLAALPRRDRMQIAKHPLGVLREFGRDAG
jgi:hypothetical protein